MIEFDVKIQRLRVKETGELVSAQAFRSIFGAALTIMRDAKRSMKRSQTEAPEGKPPHTRRGLLPRAITFSADRKKKTAVIGPRHSVAGRAGAAHEHGGSYRGRRYPQRAFMEPALRRNQHRLVGGNFTGRLGG